MDKQQSKKCDKCQSTRFKLEPKKDLAGNIIKPFIKKVKTSFPNSYVCVEICI